MTKERNLPQLESLHRISKIPVVETGVQIASGVYGKIKNSNALMKWYLDGVEGGVTFVLDKSLTAVPLLEFPLSVADTIVCKGLDTVQQKVPGINYPTEKILKETKEFVSSKIVEPVLKRAESAKEITLSGATKYGELAASRIDTALTKADQYVEKYLPDATDTTDGKGKVSNSESKTSQTIEHANRLSRKLQRRLTKRTIAEARALRRQGVDTAQILLKLAELGLRLVNEIVTKLRGPYIPALHPESIPTLWELLLPQQSSSFWFQDTPVTFHYTIKKLITVMVRDPKQFAAKIKAIWEHLSKDEPENQVPPANLEQLIEMITRETARRFVHLTNYSVKKASKLPTYAMQTIHFVTHQANIILDQALKVVHLEGAKTIAVARAKSQIRNLNYTLRDVQILIENLVSSLLSNQQHKGRTPERPIPLHTLSPVAQSPERPQEEPSATIGKPVEPDTKKESSTQPQPKSSSPKKQRKNKTSTNRGSSPTKPTITIQPEDPKPADINSNSQHLANGDAPTRPE